MLALQFKVDNSPFLFLSHSAKILHIFNISNSNNNVANIQNKQYFSS